MTTLTPGEVGGVLEAALAEEPRIAAASAYVFGTNFQSRGRRFRENALIHGMLHTLGPRETPPSSAEISRPGG